MRLRTLSKLLVASLLAGCAGGGAEKRDDTLDHTPPPPPAPVDSTAFRYQDGVWYERLADGSEATHHAIPAGLVIEPGSRPMEDLQAAADRVAADPEAASAADHAAVAAMQQTAGSAGVVRPLAGGAFLVTFDDGYLATTLVVVDGAATVVDQRAREIPHDMHPRGRRPEGLTSSPARAAGARARFLAEAHHLEAASVPAFERLAAELAGLGAPARLVRAARAAARDERRHAEAMRRLGAATVEVEVAAPAPRDAAAIALENAVEGCVNEAFAAILCDYQAARAADPEIAAAMAEIAEDEHRHAALAFAIAAWLEPRLAPAERAAIDRAVAESLATLPARAAADAERFTDAAGPLGLPGRAHAVALAVGFSSATIENAWSTSASPPRSSRAG